MNILICTILIVDKINADRIKMKPEDNANEIDHPNRHAKTQSHTNYSVQYRLPTVITDQFLHETQNQLYVANMRIRACTQTHIHTHARAQRDGSLCQYYCVLHPTPTPDVQFQVGKAARKSYSI